MSVSAVSATSQFILRDVFGSLGAVLFAASRGNSFDAYAKQYRLFADVMNNLSCLRRLLVRFTGNARF